MQAKPLFVQTFRFVPKDPRLRFRARLRLPMLFLTYHKVSAASADQEFYTVSPGQLSEHLALLKEHRYRPGDLDALLAGKNEESAYFLTFDDGTLDHVTHVLPLLQVSGERGIFFIPTAKLDHPGYLTRAQVLELSEAGHAIGCHSHEHRRLDTMTDAQIEEQLGTSLGILREITGRACLLFAPPGGYSSASVRRIATQRGLHAVRTMAWGVNRPARLDALECIPINRATTCAQLGKILDGRGFGWLKALYVGKQALKSLISPRSYERMRSFLHPSNPRD